MPLPLPTVHPRLLDTIARYYPHTVTVQRDTGSGRDDYGAPVEDWQNLAGHTGIAARVVSNGPGTGAGGWSGEIYAPDGTYDVDGRTMSLRGHFPGITEMDRVVWDGFVYEIQAVESDAEGVTTRLRARKVR
jgi:hypothetical protein